MLLSYSRMKFCRKYKNIKKNAWKRVTVSSPVTENLHKAKHDIFLSYRVGYLMDQALETMLKKFTKKE